MTKSQTESAEKMTALVFTAIGKLELVELPLPELVRPDDVLIEVKAAGVCGSDLHGYTGASGRRTPPLIMGHEAAGRVVAVGPGVTRTDGLRVGARVALMPLELRGGKRRLLGMDAPGAYAAYVVWPADRLFALPDTLSYDAGAFAEPLAVALHALDVSRRLVPDSKTAFVAGAGTIGLLIAAVLLASGVEVIVSDVSDARLAVAQAIGVGAGGVGVGGVINPARDEFGARVHAFTDGRGVDVSFEAVGISATVGQSLGAVRDGGTVVWVGNNQRLVEVDMQAVVTRELNVLGSYGLSDANFSEALRWLSEDRIPTETLTSRRVPLTGSAGLFDELLASPETIKCLIQPGS